jgi:hypothetical protein
MAAPAAYGAPAAPPRKKRKGLLYGCGGGCLVLLIAVCGGGGYLYYLEEMQDRDEPGEEVASIPIWGGQGLAFTVSWEGTGYADHIFWLVTPEPLPAGTRVTGEFGCGGTQAPTPIDREVQPDSMARPEWLSLGSDHNEYMRSGQSVECTIRIAGDLPPDSRLVVTTFQRPSDYFAD